MSAGELLLTVPPPGESRPDVLLLAVGNPSRGDDALGPLLLDRLEADLTDAIAARRVELLADFQLQIDSKLLGDLGPGQIDEPQHILGRGPGFRHDEIGVTLADFRLPDAGSLQPRLINQEAGTDSSRIFKDASGRLEAERRPARQRRLTPSFAVPMGTPSAPRCRA